MMLLGDYNRFAASVYFDSDGVDFAFMLIIVR